jgi:large subunit ribosomal protein L5
MKYTPSLKKKYQEEIIPALMKHFGYKNVMQVPRLKKIVVNRGVGEAVADKKLADITVDELTMIAGQKAMLCMSKKDVSNFKLRRGMPIGAKVTLRDDRMYEFLERLICLSIPRVRDFQGVGTKMDGKGNYSLGITEQIIFPEIDIDKINKILGLEINFITDAKTDEEGFALLKEFGLPFKKN